jgi:hypothetical protein
LGEGRRKRRFGERSPGERASIVVVLVASLAIVALAQRDLHQRSTSAIRGNKLLWQVVCTNALGALAYLRWGRRPDPVSARFGRAPLSS